MFPAIFEHIQAKCNLEPIKDLLRTIKDSSRKADQEIFLGTTKEEAVQNLRQAASSRYVETDALLELLRRAEETGHQHILLLCPATGADAPKSLKAKDVAQTLFDGRSEEIFPRFEYPSNGYAWSDFRINGDGWIAKAYGREVFKSAVGTTIEEIADGRIQEIREYEFREVKTALIARWEPQSGILEFRIDISGIQTTQTLAERRAAFWRLFEPAFGRNCFVGLNVEGLLNSLVFEREIAENQPLYSISRVELTDPRSGLIRVLPFQSEDFDNDPGRKNALQAMKESRFVPSMARIDWKPDADEAPATMRDLSIVLEKTANGPELRILKRVPSEVYEYVLGQLRKRL